MAPASGTSGNSRTIFVTVGTTRFDALIKCVLHLGNPGQLWVGIKQESIAHTTQLCNVIAPCDQSGIRQLPSGMWFAGANVYRSEPSAALFTVCRAVDDLDFADAALARGYTRLLVQRGAGAYVPHNLVKEGQDSGTLPNGLEVR